MRKDKLNVTFLQVITLKETEEVCLLSMRVPRQ